MPRAHQIILLVSLLICSWLGMQMIHELGHVLGAWMTGGHVTKVVLHPLTLSRTDVSPNPQPLVVVWFGPFVGIVLPLVFYLTAKIARVSWAYLLRFFAGFCLLSNGLYLGIGSFTRVGDCCEMLQNGSSIWQLWLFGLLTAPLGLWLWHRQGAEFGFGTAAKKINPNHAFTAMAVGLLLIALGLAVGRG
jgi:hypothetical protein